MVDITPVLEPAAQEFADSTATPPFLFELPIVDGRRVVDSVQDGDVAAPAVEMTDLTVTSGPKGEVSIRICRPAGSVGVLPVVLYSHGAERGGPHIAGPLLYYPVTDAGLAVDSFNTKNAQRDGHVRSADFLEVDKYPTMTSRSMSVHGSVSEFTLRGELTLHGVTREVELATEFNGVQA